MLGNFVSRVTKFAAARFGATVPAGGAYGPAEAAVTAELARRLAAYEAHMEAIELRKAAQELRAIWVAGNEYLQAAAPWTAIRTDPDRAAAITRFALNLIRLYAVLGRPFLPDASDAMLAALAPRRRRLARPTSPTALAALPAGHPFDGARPALRQARRRPPRRARGPLRRRRPDGVRAAPPPRAARARPSPSRETASARELTEPAAVKPRLFARPRGAPPTAGFGHAAAVQRYRASASARPSVAHLVHLELLPARSASPATCSSRRSIFWATSTPAAGTLDLSSAPGRADPGGARAQVAARDPRHARMCRCMAATCSIVRARQRCCRGSSRRQPRGARSARVGSCFDLACGHHPQRCQALPHPRQLDRLPSASAPIRGCPGSASVVRRACPARRPHAPRLGHLGFAGLTPPPRPSGLAGLRPPVQPARAASPPSRRAPRPARLAHSASHSRPGPRGLRRATGCWPGVSGPRPARARR